MHHVHENQMAFDAGTLGFPSILGCQAICLQTSRGLYGFHDAKSGTQGREGMTALQVSNSKLGVFADWVTSRMQTGETPTCLFGVVNRGEQYAPSTAGDADWKNVLLGLAGALGFDGPVRGARVNDHVEQHGSIYVEYELNGGNVSVGFKRWSKMDSDFGNKVIPQTQGRVIPQGNGFTAAPLYGTGKVAPTFRKNGKGFNLNRIAIKKFIRFQ